MSVIWLRCWFLWSLIFYQWFFDKCNRRFVSDLLICTLHIILTWCWTIIGFLFVFWSHCHLTLIVLSKSCQMTIILAWGRWALFNLVICSSWLFDGCWLYFWLSYWFVRVIVTWSWILVVFIFILLSNCEGLGLWSKTSKMAIILSWSWVTFNLLWWVCFLFDSCKGNFRLCHRIMIWIIVAWAWIIVVNFRFFLPNCKWLCRCSKFGEMTIILSWRRARIFRSSIWRSGRFYHNRLAVW